MDNGVSRSVQLSSSLHFSSLAEYRAAGQGKPVLIDQTTQGVDNGYGLQGNPTLHELQDAISKLEKGNHTLLYPSGLTALTALSTLLKPGDHWALPDSVYGPMRRFANYIDQQYGIKCDYYDPSLIDTLAAAIKDKTKLIHIETPSSVTFNITDVKAVVKLAKSKGILTSADNTWASGVLNKPLDQGVDISLLSLTKYPAGYSDVFMGSLTIKNPELFEEFSYNHRVFGYTVSPFSAMLVNRGLESLEARLAVHASNAKELIGSIKDHPKVKNIYKVEYKDFSDINGLFSVGLDRYYNDEDLEKAFGKFKTFRIGESWGGTRSLVLPFQPEEFKGRFTLPKNTIVRFHAGLESLEFQIKDIKKFLEALD